MGQCYSYSTTWVKSIVAIIHIYGPGSISPLFCNHRDTEPEWREMEIGVTGLILTQKISKSLWVNDIHNIQDVRKNCDNNS